MYVGTYSILHRCARLSEVVPYNRMERSIDHHQHQHQHHHQHQQLAPGVAATEDVLVDYEADDSEADETDIAIAVAIIGTDDTNDGENLELRVRVPVELELEAELPVHVHAHVHAHVHVPVGASSSAGKRKLYHVEDGHGHGDGDGDGESKRLRIRDSANEGLPDPSQVPSYTGADTRTRTDTRTDTRTIVNSSFGVYIPPFRRKQLEQQQQLAASSSAPSATHTTAHTTALLTIPSIQTQRQQWELLKKTINGTINRLNNNTIKDLIHSLFKDANLIRGKGLLAKSIIRAATTSPTFSPVYSSLIAVINTKLPEIGELILVRAILTFRKSYARRDKSLTMAITNFIGCLFNQGLCHELLCLQLLTVLLEGDPTDDSVDIAVHFTKIVGMGLMETSPTGVHAVMERFRNLLHDGRIARRVQYKIEELMKIRKNRFKEFPALHEELDLVEREEQITFELGLDDEGLEKEEGLDMFKYDADWYANEHDWEEIKKEVLGEDSDDDDDDDDDDEGSAADGNGNGNGESETDDDGDSEDDEDGVLPEAAAPVAVAVTIPNNKQLTEIHDMSEKDLINLRRTIYLTIMSSATFEECAHKLSKMDIPLGKEMELINMIIECCSQERTFLRYYGLIAARFCLMHRRWSNAFHESFIAQYNTIHRLETNKLRNVAKLFAHLLHTDSLSWSCLSVVHLNEDETTSSSRIFLKILVQEMAEAIGIGTLVRRFENDDPETMEWFKELFPRDNPRKTRYAINFFTSIGLGPLTDGLREYLKNAPKLIMMQAEAEAAKLKAIQDADSDDSSSVVSSSSSSSSSVSSRSVSSSSVSSSSSSSYTSRSSYSSDESRGRQRGRGRSSTKRRGKSKKRSSRRRYSSDSSVSTDDSRSPSVEKSKRKSKRSASPEAVAESKPSSKKDKDRSEGKSERKRRPASYSRSPSPRGRAEKDRSEGESKRKPASYARSPSPKGGAETGKASPVKEDVKEKVKPQEKTKNLRRKRSKSYSSSESRRSRSYSDSSRSRDDKKGGKSRRRKTEKRSYSRSSSRSVSRDRDASKSERTANKRSNY